MRALYVHGLGRTPLSGWPLMLYLKRAGVAVSVFGYSATAASAHGIVSRLAAKIARVAERDDYVLIGHSLGGVLLRAALNELPEGAMPPRRLFLLGSPVRPAHLAVRLQDNPLYRVITRDCGQLLASEERMQHIGPAAVPTTVIVGTIFSASGGGPHDAGDGVVWASEAAVGWTADEVRLPVVHTLLPASRQVARAILERIAADGGRPAWEHAAYRLAFVFGGLWIVSRLLSWALMVFNPFFSATPRWGPSLWVTIAALAAQGAICATMIAGSGRFARWQAQR